jgi:hypothetical protein
MVRFCCLGFVIFLHVIEPKFSVRSASVVYPPSGINYVKLPSGINYVKLPPLAIIIASCGTNKLMRSGHKDVLLVRCECNNSNGINFCYEGDSFLAFLISVYDSPIAARYVFAHDHFFSWHYQSGFWNALRHVMGTSYWRRHKYGGIFKGYWKIGQTGPWGGIGEKKWVDPLYKIFYAGTSMPAEPVWNNSFPCCSTFFIDEKLIRNRRKDEYIRIRQQMRAWVRKNLQMPDPGYAYKCGRVFEFTWHMLLSKSGFVPFCNECLQ